METLKKPLTRIQAQKTSNDQGILEVLLSVKFEDIVGKSKEELRVIFGERIVKNLTIHRMTYELIGYEEKELILKVSSYIPK